MAPRRRDAIEAPGPLGGAAAPPRAPAPARGAAAAPTGPSEDDAAAASGLFFNAGAPAGHGALAGKGLGRPGADATLPFVPETSSGPSAGGSPGLDSGGASYGG